MEYANPYSCYMSIMLESPVSNVSNVVGIDHQGSALTARGRWPGVCIVFMKVLIPTSWVACWKSCSMILSQITISITINNQDKFSVLLSGMIVDYHPGLNGAFAGQSPNIIRRFVLKIKI